MIDIQTGMKNNKRIKHTQIYTRSHIEKHTEYTTTPSMHTHTHPFNGPVSGTTRVGRYQKGKTNLDLLKQETVSGSGI